MLNLLLNLDCSQFSSFDVWNAPYFLHIQTLRNYMFCVFQPLWLSLSSMKIWVKRITKKVFRTTKPKENWMWFKSITGKAKRRPVISMHTHIRIVVVVIQKCWLKATLRSKVEVRGGDGKFWQVFLGGGGDDKYKNMRHTCPFPAIFRRFSISSKMMEAIINFHDIKGWIRHKNLLEFKFMENLKLPPPL